MLSPDIKNDFPWFRSPMGRKTTYLDSAATTHKPRAMLESLRMLYEEYNAAVNRSSHESGGLFSEMYLDAHRSMASFIGGKDPGEIVFTRNCTDAINIAATAIDHSVDTGYALKPGDRIVVSIMEHHSNMVPWQELARRTGAQILYAGITDDGRIDLDHLNSLVDDRTRIVAVSHASNVLGTINPVKEIAALCRDRGVLSVVDGTQSVPHLPVNVKDIGCDLYAFSGHKMLGPGGTGVLYGRRQVLEMLTPSCFGGGMIREVTDRGASWNDIPWKFEPGTPDACGAIALAGAMDPSTGRHIDGAVDYLKRIGMDKVLDHERTLAAAALRYLGEIDEVRIIGSDDPMARLGIISFVLVKGGKTIDCHALGELMDRQGVAIRAGGHCAYPLMRRLGIEGTLRISFHVYNDNDDLARFFTALKNAIRSVL